VPGCAWWASRAVVAATAAIIIVAPMIRGRAWRAALALALPFHAAIPEDS